MSLKRVESYSGYESWNDYVDRSVNTKKNSLTENSQNMLNTKREQLKKKPPLDEFLEHQKTQYSLATKNGWGNELRWKILNITTINVEEALISGCHSDIVMRSIALSRAIDAFQQPTNHMLMKMLKALISKNKRELPLKAKNQKLAIVKEHVQLLAKTRWTEDFNNELRMIDMCHAVWQELVETPEFDEIKDVLPDRAELLKKWIRPAAPDWAKKGGAPKK